MGKNFAMLSFALLLLVRQAEMQTAFYAASQKRSQGIPVTLGIFTRN
jgi:hypothetical protein